MRRKATSLALSLAPALLIVAAVFPADSQAAATVTVVNLDGAGEGFNDPSAADPDSTAGGNTGATLGAQRMQAFQFAADIWGGILDSSVEIRVGANLDPLDCDATSAILGAAGPVAAFRDFDGALADSTFYPVALANKLGATDYDPGYDDITAAFNSSIGTTCSFPYVWYYGLDANPPVNKIDFATIVLHELAHGLGFLTFVDLATGAKLSGYDDTYMLNLEDHSTGELYPDMTNAERVTASKDTGDLHWVGPNVIADGADLTAGRDVVIGHVQMYAPDPQETGSSVSHFDTALSPDELLEPYFTGVPEHDPGLAVALLLDLGWFTCGNDVLEAPEECDDGNTTPCDGCGTTCMSEAPGCCTVVSTDVPKLIPDEGSVTSTLSVPISGSIADVDVVGLKGEHYWMGDLEFHLISPSSTNVTLIDNVCSSDDGFDVDLDDEASTAITCPPTDGQAHWPESPLSAFDDEDASGAWNLQVFDQEYLLEGTLDGWGVHICVLTCGNDELDPGEQCDDGNTDPGDCCSPTCQYESAGTVCRTGSGDLCDPDETCTGTNGTCPGDTVSSASTVCDPGSGDLCDPDELCSGIAGQACPADSFEPGTTVCRTGSGDLCDPDELCPGVAGAACPGDTVSSASTVCDPGSGDLCDPDELCSGIAGQSCPADSFEPATTECRPASGACDIAEFCPGVADAACPDDEMLPCADLPSASPAGRVLIGLLMLAAGALFLFGNTPRGRT